MGSPTTRAIAMPAERYGPKANLESPVFALWIIPKMQPRISPRNSPTTTPDTEEQAACQHQFCVAPSHGTFAGQNYQQEQRNRCRCGSDQVGEQRAISGADIVNRNRNAQQPDESNHIQTDQLGVQVHEKDHDQSRTEQTYQSRIDRLFKDAEIGKDQHV